MKKTILLFFLALVSTHGVQAATYYVDPSGNDANAGTSSSAPFSSLSKGVSKVVAGDTLYVSGNYTTPLILSKSGTAGQTISVIGINSPRLDVGSSTAGISLTGSYLKVSGFTVIGGSSYGIYTDGQHNEILNNTIKNSVRENGTGPCLNNAWGSALKLRIGADDIKIIGNTISESCGEGMGITRAKNVVIENNTVFDNFSVNIYIDNSYNVTVRNNYTYCKNSTYYRNNAAATGILLGTENYAGWGDQFYNVTIDNNKIDSCRPIRFYNEIGATPNNITITNNYFHSVATPYAVLAGATLSNNVSWDGVVGSPQSSNPNNPIPTITKVPSSTPSTNGLIDLTSDGLVNIFDYNMLIKDFGKRGTSGWIKSDIVQNGTIDIFDYNMFLSAYTAR